MNHLDKAKSALEYASSYPVRDAKDVALVAIANALVSIAEREPTLERIEDKSRWHELFGTPERAARTYLNYFLNGCDGIKCSDGCPFYDASGYLNCALGTDDYDTLLEWLRGDAK